MTDLIQKNFEATRQKIVSILAGYAEGGYIQTLSKLLVYMGKEQAQETLSKLPEPVRSKVQESYKNFCDKKITDPEIIADAARVLKDSGFFGKELCDSVSKDLPYSERDALINCVNEIFEKDPLVAMSVEKHLIAFDVLLDIDDRSIQRILRETDRNTLAMALVNAPQNIQEKIFRNFSKRAAFLLKEDIEFMGPVKMVDVNAARDEVIRTIIRLSNEGQIVIGNYWN